MSGIVLCAVQPPYQDRDDRCNCTTRDLFGKTGFAGYTHELACDVTVALKAELVATAIAGATT